MSAAEDLTEEESIEVAKVFLNRPALQHHFITRQSMWEVDETYLLHEIPNGGLVSYGKFCLRDGAARMYGEEVGVPSLRKQSFIMWLAEEMNTYRKELLGEESVAVSKSSGLAALMGSDEPEEFGTTERDWSMGAWCAATTSKQVIDGMALQVKAVKLTPTEISSIAVAKKRIEELVASMAEGKVLKGGILSYGRGIRVSPNKPRKVIKGNEIPFNTGLVNITPTADQVVERFSAILSKPGKDQPTALTGLFHGAPGTGKTALAQHLADALDKKLIKKDYSQIQSKYVSEGEKNLKAIFDESSGKDKILLLDEIDSIASSRAKADKAYDRTMTNQLLTCVDNFEGIIIVTTNFLSAIDPAVLRRFFLKTEFGFLTVEQQHEALRTFFPRRFKDKVLPEIEFLTAGDFKVIKEKSLYEPKTPTFDRVVEMLQEEIEVKLQASPELRERSVNKSPMGFH